VAECCCNHLGDIKIAKAMIDAAKWAGADTVKFQMYETELINDPKLHDFLRKAELTIKDHADLICYCQDISIQYLCSAFDVPSLKNLASLNVDRIKIPSGQLHSKTYLECAKSLGKPLILSTGMSTWEEVCDAWQILKGHNIINFNKLLQCNSAYPTPDEDANLFTIKELASDFGLIGFSDHTLGSIAAILAVALGAIIIEKHFILSKFFKTPDTETSMTPVEFKKYVEDIRRAERMLGSGKGKNITESEKPNLHRRDFR